MDILVLKRISNTPNGTPGVLLGTDDWPIGVSLELQQPIVPEGEYFCSPYFSPAHQHNCFLINDVPGHSGVEIHWGNDLKDTLGCVLIAQDFSLFQPVEIIESSRVEFGLLWDKYGQTGFRLAVRS